MYFILRGKKFTFIDRLYKIWNINTALLLALHELAEILGTQGI